MPLQDFVYSLKLYMSPKRSILVFQSLNTTCFCCNFSDTIEPIGHRLSWNYFVVSYFINISKHSHIIHNHNSAA